MFKAEGCLVSLLICSCQCCLFSLERFFKFASKDSYVFTSIFGFSFCKGSHEAFYMVGRNADSGAVEGIYNEANLLFCKFCIVAITSTATLLGMSRSGEDFFVVGTLTLTVAVISWFIVGIFLELCSSATLTMLYCYLVDDEVFEHEGVTIFAPEQLLRVLRCGDCPEHLEDDEDDDENNDEEDIEKGLSKEYDVEPEAVSIEVEEEEIAEAGSDYEEVVSIEVEEEEMAEAGSEYESDVQFEATSEEAGDESLLDQVHTEEEDDETGDVF